MTTTDPVTFPFEATRPGVLIVARHKAVIAGLATELDSDVRYLEKLAAEIKPV
jgi:hypothetical protein